MGPLETLLWVYPLLLLLNGFIAVALWTIYRKSIFGLLVGVWASTLVNFSLQGAFLESSLASVLGFSTYIVTAWFLCKILCTITHQLFSFRSGPLLRCRISVGSIARCNSCRNTAN